MSSGLVPGLLAVTVPPVEMLPAARAPQRLVVPLPPQLWGNVHDPQLAVRASWQLSLAATLPQFLPSRMQNALSLSGTQPPSVVPPSPVEPPAPELPLDPPVAAPPSSPPLPVTEL